ncbi:MAG: recombinase RecF, partial [Gammaproteobacteria bacterium]|nr:recombinase RecF [Gammaproteobacteria bacterium]
MDKDGRALVALITSMTTELTTLENYILGREAVLNPQYNDALHKALKEATSRLPAIQQLGERLRSEDIQITFTFNDDEMVVAARLEELRNLMRAKKTEEALVPPEDWRQTINAVFKDVQDFYILDPQDLKNKERYIKVKANEAQSIRLQKCLEDLQKIQRENDAAGKAKDKVTKLYTTLRKAERKYSDQTISEIELIFHIYSG